MKRLTSLIFAVVYIMLVFTGCAVKYGGESKTENFEQPEQTYNRVIAASGSLAHVWVLAGGNDSLIGASHDSFDGRFELPENTENVGKLHQINLEQIIALEPDYVILSGEISSQVTMRENLAKIGIPAECFSVDSFEDYLDLLKTFTEKTGKSDLYIQNGLNLKTQIDEIIEASADKPSQNILLLRANSGKVQARNSDTTAGIMLKDLGCANIADTDSDMLESLSLEIIIKKDPDFIFVVFQGEDEEKSQQALEDALTSNPAWSELKAVKNGQFIILPKDLFHQKPNDRWAEAYSLLREILYE